MKKLRTIIEILANNRSYNYKQFSIVNIRLRLFASSAMISSRFFSVDEVTHVLLCYYNLLYEKANKFNYTVFQKYFESGEAYAETGEATLRDLISSNVEFHSFELEYILSGANKNYNIYSLNKLLEKDASNSLYSYNSNIYLTFNDVSNLENDTPIQDINKEEIENFIIFRQLDRSNQSPIA